MADFFTRGVTDIVQATLGTEPWIATVIHQGGTSCFSGDTLVCTSDGLKPIKHVIPGDTVLSHNTETHQDEWKTVTDSLVFENTKETVKIKLKNGETITVTTDHRFWFNGKWETIENILKLWKNGK